MLQHGLSVHGRWTRCYVQLTAAGEVYPEFGTHVRIGFAVPKKIASSSVLRNRIRRLMREAVRMEKEPLWDGLSMHRRTAILVLMLRRHDPAALKKLTLNDIAAEWHSMVPKIISLC